MEQAPSNSNIAARVKRTVQKDLGHHSKLLEENEMKKNRKEALAEAALASEDGSAGAARAELGRIVIVGTLRTAQFCTGTGPCKEAGG